MAFNLKKASKFDTSLPLPKQLDDKRKEFNQVEPDEGTTERQLESNVRKDKDNTVPFNKQLESVRTGTSEVIAEGQLNDAKKLYNDRRDDSLHTKKVTAVNLVSEAYHQEKLKAFREAQDGSERDTSFWDKEVGVQMQGEKTKIVSNKQKSQLQNHPDRFKGIKPDLSTSKDFDDMVTASLRQADKMQFAIFANASSSGRKLTKSEIQQIADINSGKARIIASYESAMQKKAQSMLAMKPAAPGDDISPEVPDASNPVNEPTQDTKEHYTITPESNGYTLYHQIWTGNGPPQNKKIGTFATEQEAHDHAAKDPSLDGVPFLENGATPSHLTEPDNGNGALEEFDESAFDNYDQGDHDYNQSLRNVGL